MAETIEVNVKSAQEYLRKSGINVHKAMPRLLGKLAGQGERMMKRIVPVDTGNLKNSTGSQVFGASGAVISNSANYALFVDRGTKFMKGRFFVERTKQHIIKQLPVETSKIIQEAFKV